jgi:hypothetical protein
MFFLFANGAIRGDAPASMWRYSIACFLTMTSIVLVASYVRSRWGFGAPVIVGYAGIVISIIFAALLFGRDHRRQLLPAERGRFITGCFLTLWFYNEFLAIVSRSLTHAGWTEGKVIDGILDTGIDFILVWAIIRYGMAWVLRPVPQPKP